MKNKSEFDRWLDYELSQGSDSSFDNSQSSPRNVILRYRKSKISAIKYELGEMIRNIKHEIKTFDFLEITIGQIIYSIVFVCFFWVILFMNLADRYSFAIEYYKRAHAMHVTKTQRRKNTSY